MAEAAIEGEQKGGKMKMILLGVGAVLLLVGIGIGAYFLGTMRSGDTTIEAGKVTADAAMVAKAEASTGIGPLVALDEIIVNLLDNQESRYLKTALTLEVDGQPAADEVDERKPQVRDAILLLLSSKTFAELHDLQGKMQLRAELLERINAFLQKGRVKTIYFTDFVVQ